MSFKILIAEDDPDLGHLLKQYLELNGFDVTKVSDGSEVLAQLQKDAYDLVVLDVMMPNEDGFTLAAKLNTHHPQLPFLFLTAKKLREDILEGLKLGAEDYMVKPFDADELILRIRNILKRVKKDTSDQPSLFSIGAYSFDYENLQLIFKDEIKILTDKEAKLLRYFCTHQHELIKRRDVLSYLWKEPDFFSGRSMDVFISRLRKYFSKDPSIHIDSVRGVGFRFYQQDK